jgi:dolichyl-diphosphooligosaccharide--protein glycosyltransferase
MPAKVKQEAKAAPAPETPSSNDGGFLSKAGTLAMQIALIALALNMAYEIRLYAIKGYGLVIHEFDPWFNFRATQYLADNGWEKFSKWFDYMSWYPLGRPVGTTIYPGMQITSVAIFEGLKALGPDWEMSLNDVCCYVPAWFGVLATAFLGLLSAECSGSTNAGVASALVMAIIPAHIMRSVGGGYDNESVAMTAMCATFYFWVRSLRNDNSWWIGAIAGLAYIYMGAAWGGYIFVINMVAMHAGMLLLLGRHSTKLFRSYALFYVIGTWGVMQVPVIGWTPLKSLEQLGALAVLLAITAQECCCIYRRSQTKNGKEMTDKEFNRFRMRFFGGCGAVGLVVIYMILPPGYFGPLSSRVRGLFVKHTRTGNPLVDSVAEHQPANAGAYWQYLHVMNYGYLVGFIMCFKNRTDSKYFTMFYAIMAYFFSNKMMRLIILMGPIASALGGAAIAAGLEWSFAQLQGLLNELAGSAPEKKPEETPTNTKYKPGSSRVPASSPTKSGKGKKDRSKKKARAGPKTTTDVLGLGEFVEFYETEQGLVTRRAGAAFFLLTVLLLGRTFYAYSHRLAEAMSQPSIMFKAQMRDGSTIMVDDYREAYWWLRDNTPEDSRVLAWWDYGYQITGIANRTTIADGNTWNHEHIATLGRALTSPEKRAHKIVRHLADYVLIWTGGGGDDLAKSPHMARIGNSVYHDICPGDPTCRKFGFVNQGGTPTKMMAASLLYKLHSHNQKPGVRANPKLFKEVFTSKYNKVRIFKVRKVSKKSKAWNADPTNRKCDVPGSWYCVGQYPPALHKLIAKRKDFKQLEDFNVERTDEDDEYTREYMRRMAGYGGEDDEDEDGEDDSEETRQRRLARHKARQAAKKKMITEDVAEDDDDDDNEEEEGSSEPVENDDDEEEEEDDAPLHSRDGEWADTADTTRMWDLIHRNDVESLQDWLEVDPSAVYMRSGDGRGPLWWAHEYDRDEIVEILIGAGADPAAKDSSGLLPASMSK